jgi:pimeloyl-ACP methyl ester carboxylesterase
MLVYLLLLPLLALAMSLAISFGGFAILAADRGRPVVWGRRVLSVYVREALARCLVIAASPLGWTNPGPKARRMASNERQRTPVLLLPGYATNRSCLAPLCLFLANRGWSWLWPINLGRRDQSLAVHAADLADRVDVLCRRTGAAKIDIVAFSMGGLVAAWYLRHLGGSDKVRRLVTIGTPWRGTRVAVFAKDTLARDLLYEAHVLDALSPPPAPTICIWSPDDPVVVPSASGVADQGAQSVRIDAAGHVDMLLSARVYRAVQAALSHPISEPA